MLLGLHLGHKRAKIVMRHVAGSKRDYNVYARMGRQAHSS